MQVSRCTKIINPNTDDAKYLINIKQIAKFVVGLGDKVAPTDIEEGMRVGYVFGLFVLRYIPHSLYHFVLNANWITLTFIRIMK